MRNLFLILDIISIIAFLLSLIAPNLLIKVFKNKLAKGKIILIFGISIVVFFVLFGMSSAKLEDLFSGLILLSILFFFLSWITPDSLVSLFKNKLSKGKIRLIFGLSIIVFFIAFGINSSPIENKKDKTQETASTEKDTLSLKNKPESSREDNQEDIPLLGSEFILKYDEKTDNKIFIVDTEENYITLMKSSTINDTEGYSEIFKKHAILVNNGTKVRVIEYVKSNEGITYKGIKVRVLEGDKYNSVGYATRPFLKKINENETISKSNDGIQTKNEEATDEITESVYRARILSEGEKISNAGIYIMLAGKYYESGDYDQCEKDLNKASDTFRDINWTFKGQTNPPAKYVAFNKNMVVLFSDISDSIDNMSTAIANGSKSVYKKELNNLTGLINKVTAEMTKAGF